MREREMTTKLGIGIPLSYHSVPADFFMSFAILDKPSPHLLYRASKGSIDEMRNEIVKGALTDGCTHLIMLDTDQVYPPATILQLLAHKLPVVGGLIHRRYPPFDPLMLRGSLGKYRRVEEWNPYTLVEVDATGGGCLLFNMDIFRQLPEPWFCTTKDDDGNPIGEDIWLCSTLREAGIPIYVDTSIVVGHLSQMQVTSGTWKWFKRVQAAQAKAMAQAKEKLKDVTVIIPVTRPQRVQGLIDSLPPDVTVIAEEDKELIGVTKMVKKLTQKAETDYVCFLGDDCEPLPGMLEEALVAMSTLPDGWGLVGLNTDNSSDTIRAGHWLCHRNILNALDGEFFHTGYYHSFCDNELTDRAIEMGRYVFAENAKVHHNHPDKGHGVWDAEEMDKDETTKRVYAKEIVDMDKALYTSRKANNWQSPERVTA